MFWNLVLCCLYIGYFLIFDIIQCNFTIDMIVDPRYLWIPRLQIYLLTQIY